MRDFVLEKAWGRDDKGILNLWQKRLMLYDSLEIAWDLSIFIRGHCWATFDYSTHFYLLEA